MDVKDDDYPPKSGILPQYAHLRGLEQNMPVIRQILGISPDGNMPNNFIGRTMQRFIETNRKKAVCESGFDINSPIE